MKTFTHEDLEREELNNFRKNVQYYYQEVSNQPTWRANNNYTYTGGTATTTVTWYTTTAGTTWR